MKLIFLFFNLIQSYNIIELENNLDILVESLRTSNGIPGLSLAVVDLRNQAFITKGYGKRRVDEDDPVSNETLFCLASNSKLFTGIYSALVEKYTGISLDQKINDIPELRDDADIFLMLNTCALSQEVTLRDLLSHRTGTKDDSMTLTLGGDLDTRDIFASRSRFLLQQQSLRSKYKYSNSGYTLAGHVAEKLCQTSSFCMSMLGNTWEEGMESIFNLAGMQNSVVAQNITKNAMFFDDKTARSTLVDWLGNQHPNSLGVISRSKAMEPSYGVVSSSKDMARWIEFILSSPMTAELKLGTDFDQDGIPCTGCRKVFSKGTGSSPTDTEVVYALGTRTGMYRDYRKWAHSGSFGGYNSYLYMLPDMKIGVFVAVNGGGDTYGAMRKIIYYSFDTLLELSPSLHFNSTTVNDPEEESHRKINPSQIFTEKSVNDDNPILYQPKSLEPEFDKLTGSFFHPLLGEMKISLQNRRSCQNNELYESLYVQIGALGTGWIENLAFYDTGIIHEKYLYPLSLEPSENEQCCFGARCQDVAKIIPGVYPLVGSNDSPSLDSWTDVNFIWDSPVWYVSDYDPVFTFHRDEFGEFSIEFRKGKSSSDVYLFTRNQIEEFEWIDNCNLNAQ
ncbi:unnamed protein product [Oikopleura dioica]|uniref:Beta-lactamase-related domain-containing protein n=1 Tax=Oikopleura dioica TaxID=34765 RepID=E4XI89_OIKDI|nr:unnamed protein product [Oikopleura dioica]